MLYSVIRFSKRFPEQCPWEEHFWLWKGIAPFHPFFTFRGVCYIMSCSLLGTVLWHSGLSRCLGCPPLIFEAVWDPDAHFQSRYLPMYLGRQQEGVLWNEPAVFQRSLNKQLFIRFHKYSHTLPIEDILFICIFTPIIMTSQVQKQNFKKKKDSSFCYLISLGVSLMPTQKAVFWSYQVSRPYHRTVCTHWVNST